jgi:hypothetical protein
VTLGVVPSVRFAGCCAVSGRVKTCAAYGVGSRGGHVTPKRELQEYLKFPGFLGASTLSESVTYLFQ